MYYRSGAATMFSGPYWPAVYGDQLTAVHDHGAKREARGTVSYELRPTLAVVEETGARFVVVPGRGLNHCFAIAETVCVIAPHNSVEFLRFYNSRSADFSSDGETFEGHYGERLCMGRQLEYVIEELKRDPGSRRAVATIWNPLVDTCVGKRDYPCNVMVTFKIMNGKLDAHVIRRSSDLLWGVPYDHVVFTVLQDVVSASLGIQSGAMIETTDSLHVYRGLYDDTLERALLATSAGKGVPGLTAVI